MCRVNIYVQFLPFNLYASFQKIMVSPGLQLIQDLLAKAAAKWGGTEIIQKDLETKRKRADEVNKKISKIRVEQCDTDFNKVNSEIKVEQCDTYVFKNCKIKDTGAHKKNTKIEVEKKGTVVEDINYTLNKVEIDYTETKP